MAANGTVPAIPDCIPLVVLSQLNIKATFGADLIGLVISSIFYGITILQTIYYFGTYTSDSWSLKSLVLAVWALDTASLILFSHGVFTYLVLDFANPFLLANFVWSVASEPMITAVIAFIVHLVLAQRIRLLNPKWTIVTVVVVIWSLFLLSLGIYTTYKINAGSHTEAGIRSLRWLSITACTTSAALDILIAFCLCLELGQNKSGIGFETTNRMINTLTAYVISSGAITAVLGLCVMITYLTLPSALVFQAFTASLSKAYTNTFLATLNLRQVVRKRAEHRVGGSLEGTLSDFVVHGMQTRNSEPREVTFRHGSMGTTTGETTTDMYGFEMPSRISEKTEDTTVNNGSAERIHKV